jgi:hypothetical protein
MVSEKVSGIRRNYTDIDLKRVKKWKRISVMIAGKTRKI